MERNHGRSLNQRWQNRNQKRNETNQSEAKKKGQWDAMKRQIGNGGPGGGPLNERRSINYRLTDKGVGVERVAHDLLSFSFSFSFSFALAAVSPSFLFLSLL